MNSQGNNSDQSKSATDSQAADDRVMIHHDISNDAELIWNYSVNSLKSMIGNSKSSRFSENKSNLSTVDYLKSKAMDRKIRQLAAKLLANPKLNKRISRRIHFWDESLSNSNSGINKNNPIKSNFGVQNQITKRSNMNSSSTNDT